MMSDPTIMPFGKHKGVAVGALPDDYLRWLITLDNLHGPVAGAVRREAERPVGDASALDLDPAEARSDDDLLRLRPRIQEHPLPPALLQEEPEGSRRLGAAPCPTVDRLIAFWEANPPHACDPAS
jgi:Putative quorum-sensing-regulated virulence factor